MKTIGNLFFGCMLAVNTLGAHAGDVDVAASDGYGLEPGDVVTISVWKEEDLDQPVLIRPDGGISFPLIGDIQAAGLSVEQLRLLVADKLSAFIPDPSVSITIANLGGNKIYVIGQVARPGELTLNRYVDVTQALAMAGGATTFAAVNDIKILRRTDGTSIAIPFKFSEIEEGKNLEQNIVLQAGDVIIVP